MEAVYACCAGLDVHKATVVACARWIEQGQQRQEVATFGTMTRDLLQLSDWLGARGVTQVAMESTGVLWKPLFNVLDDRFELLLVNARHIKQVPGRKTDVKDAEWIAQLLQHGLLKASFVPDRPQRELRDLTRHRAQLVAEQTRVANRIHKTLEDANLKLGVVASDILGVSGRRILTALIAGETDPAQLAGLAKGRLRAKEEQLGWALQGNLTSHHRFMLGLLWDHLQQLERLQAQLERQIEVLLRPFHREIELLSSIPGIKAQVAAALVAEIGVDMSVFPSDAHLASWAGVCPGNHESAGKHQSGRTTKGNRWLRRCLSQAAWAASHTKNTYFSAQYRRLAGRRGKKRAIVAVGHSLLVVAYHVLRTGQPYQELGADYFQRRRPDSLRRSLVHQLEHLGYQVSLQPVAA